MDLHWFGRNPEALLLSLNQWGSENLSMNVPSWSTAGYFVLPRAELGWENGECVQLTYVLGDLAYSVIWKKAMSSKRVRTSLEMQVELILAFSAKLPQQMPPGSSAYKPRPGGCLWVLSVLRFALRILIMLTKSKRPFVRVGPGFSFQFSFNVALSFWLKPIH